LRRNIPPPELIEEKSFYEPHSLLYFIQKDDPRGESPQNPESDPQFAFWEEGVQNWITDPANEDFDQRSFGRETVPQEYDDVHTKETIPKISIISPTSGSSVRPGDSITLNLEVVHVFAIKEIEIFFDDKIIKTIPNVPVIVSEAQASTTEGFRVKTQKFFPSFRVPALVLGENPHIVEVRIFDEVLNRGESTFTLIIK